MFSRADYADLLLACRAYRTRHKGLRVHEYAIMPRPVHLLADVVDDEALLAQVLRELKSCSAKQLHHAVRALGCAGGHCGL